ncbi:MAG: ABC transporter permease subunit [Salinivirgaceae bacterium]|nr:ABC transporter permease subunit [Salinivirgaceae bacterium]
MWGIKLIGKKTEELIFKQLMRLANAIILFVIGLIVFTIMRKGLPALSWEIISQVPKGGYYFGGEGGVLNAIVGSIYLAFGATFLAFVISLPSALFINVHLQKHKKLQDIIRLFIDVMWGIPSVVYGAFAFGIMIYMGIRASLMAGIVTVAIFIMPIMIRGMDEVLKMVPKTLFESGLSLGSTKYELSYRIFFKQCIPGIATAILLSFGRAFGDVAAVLFTAGFTDNIPTSLTQPAATLPLAIFFQLSSPIPEVQNRAYAAAAILTFIILAISVFGRMALRKYKKNSIN